MQPIIKLQLGHIQKHIAENHKIPFGSDDEVVNVIASRCGEVESGAGVVDAILTNTVLPNISQEFLTRMMQGEKIDRVQVSLSMGLSRWFFLRVAGLFQFSLSY